jgi:propanol-preferring alcohol dehydrogenase
VKAMVLAEYGKSLEERQVPEPSLRAREVLIEVEAAALCASDVHAQAGGYSRPAGRFAALAPPIVLGHQIAGRVVKCGAEVESIQFGNRCVVFCYLYCGSCFRCLSGRQNLCQTIAKRIGFEVEGGFAEHVVVPERNTFRIDSNVAPLEAAVLPDAVSTSYHGVITRGRVEHGEKVVVFGCGALGLYAVRLCALRGAEVVAVDRTNDERLEWARRFGARAGYAWESDMSSEVLIRRLRTGLEGDADVVVDVVGSSATLAAAATVLRAKGRLVTIGVSARGNFNAAMLARKSIRVIGSLASTPSDLLSVLNLHRHGQLHPIIADTLPLSEVNQGLARLREGSVIGRLILVPGR